MDMDSYFLLFIFMDDFHWLCIVTDFYWMLSTIMDGYHWL